MSARWFRNNLVSLIAGAVFIVLLGGIIWVLHNSFDAQETVLQDLQSGNAKLEELRSSKPFPSQENIDLLRQDYENVRQLYDAMTNAAAHPPIHGPALTRDIEFSQLVRTTVNRLTAVAAEQKVRTPADFTFGFSRYDVKFPCRNPPAHGNECTKLLALLSKQLMVAETLANLLITNKVEEISAIRRTEVEPGEISADALNIPINNDPTALYQTYPFELRFTCDTATLRNILNGLTAAPGLFIARAIRIETVQVRLKSLDAPATGTDVASAEPARAVITRRLNVALRLDLVEFSLPKPRAGKG